jgi:hypothetical protein
MTRYQRLAYRLRWGLLAMALLCMAGGALFLINILWPEWNMIPYGDPASGIGLQGVMGWQTDDRPTYALVVAGYLGLFFFAQWLFLAPCRNWAVRLNETGRPMKRAVIVAALVAALLSIALIATLLELPDWWGGVVTKGNAPRFDDLRYWPPLLALAIAWLIWTAIFFTYWRHGDRYTQLTRMIRGLLAGSMAECLIIAPAHAWVAHERDCYCARGTYTGLVLGVTALLWCFGPAVILLFMRERYRLAQLTPRCAQCGYDLRGTVAADRSQCPECGAALPDTVKASSS